MNSTAISKNVRRRLLPFARGGDYVSINHINVEQAQAVEDSDTPVSFKVEDSYSNITSVPLAGASEVLAIAESISDAEAIAGDNSVYITNFSMALA